MCNEHNSEILYQLHPKKVRELIRDGRLRKRTYGIATNYAHVGFVILPDQYAYDFLLYTQRNPKACPLLEVSNKGAREMTRSAKGILQEMSLAIVFMSMGI